MPLEDHIGDICRKARLQTNTELMNASRAAGVAEEDLQHWETHGVLDSPVNVEALSELLGLDPVKAVAVSEGWEPQRFDLAQWQKLYVITTTEGFEVNSFVIWDPDNKEAAIFDTGWFAESIFERCFEPSPPHRRNAEIYWWWNAPQAWLKPPRGVRRDHKHPEGSRVFLLGSQSH